MCCCSGSYYILSTIFGKLTVTLEHTNKILKDAEVITEIAAKRSKDLDGILNDVSESVSEITDTIKGRQNTVSALVSVIKAAIAVKKAADTEKK